MRSENFSRIFFKVIEDYHEKNSILAPCNDPFARQSIDSLLYQKCWIDTVQWHQEDLIRDPNIKPQRGMELKRGIDKNNQIRTNRVEQLEDFFAERFRDTKPKEGAILNTETVGWAIDRLSILCLKIFHMKEETIRKDVAATHIKQCLSKLTTLELQRKDLEKAIDILLQNMEAGKVVFKVYRQMKMYNDETLNPILYNKKKGE